MIVVVDYGVGNLGSIFNMLKKVGASVVVSSDSSVIKKAGKLILAGVGAFDGGMASLRARGFEPLLNEMVIGEKVPILGICLGMQLFTMCSEEGGMRGLNWLNAKTVSFKFDVSGGRLKVPHMSWNTVRICQTHPVFTDVEMEQRFYFAHSYHVVCADPQMIAGETCYGYPFASVVAKDNILGVQFHPEKSHKYGMKLLKNFAEHFR